jgi:hypothetical protein
LHEACHNGTVAYLHHGLDVSSQPARISSALFPHELGPHKVGVGYWPPARHTVFSLLPPLSTMDANPQRPKERDGILSSLGLAIKAVDVAKEIVDIAPAKAVFGSVSVILTMLRVCFLLVRSYQPQADVSRIP